MIQSIYTSVNNADIVPCGKKGSTITSEPIPLLRDKYLGEYRTELERAKVRKNLGISDKYSLQWGNIEGFVEKQKDLVDYVEQKYAYTNEISEDITNVKEALDYTIFFISNYKANNEEIEKLGKEVIAIKELITTTEEALQESISENADNILAIQETITTINEAITSLNEALKNIDVDANILAWIQSNLQNSTTIKLEDNTLDIIISKQEGNAIQISEGIYVEDLSQKVAESEQNIEQIQQSQITLQEQITANSESITNIQTELETVITYQTDLSDDTQSPDTVGGISQGTTVQSLRGKSLSYIVDSLLFPTYVRDLIYPTLSYNISNRIVEVGSQVLTPILTFTQNDAGTETSRIEKLLYKGVDATNYNSLGVYTHKGTVTYNAGEYLIDNKGQITNKRVEAGSMETIVQITTTYPWYSGNQDGLIKQQLVRYDFNSGIISFSLSGRAVIKLPGANSQLISFTVDGGLGYLNVDLNGWKASTEQLNGITYKVWTKLDSYSAALPHQINFILAQ